MADPKIDELSVMTQLSYYVIEGSPGYDKTMEWVNSKLSVSTITNFSVIILLLNCFQKFLSFSTLFSI